MTAKSKTMGTGTSMVVRKCQVCESSDLHSVLFLGYLPPVNLMPKIGEPPQEEAGYPAEMLHCRNCQLMQIGLIVDPTILFPPEYPYTSGTTKILRDNFAELFTECRSLGLANKDDLVVDIGSNDGTLLSNFHKGGCRVCGVEPTDMAKLANERGIDSINAFFGEEAAKRVVKEKGKAKIITATNVFAHIENIHDIVKAILSVLDSDGVFISESHYLHALLETLQYDTIYHEHLRYYSLMSLQYLLKQHQLEVFHAKRIPTHGGSIRVYAAKKGKHTMTSSCQALLREEEKHPLDQKNLQAFKNRVVQSKLDLYTLLGGMKKSGKRIYGIGAPSRASTLINYVGLDDGIIDCVLEVKGSYKIGKYIPGKRIPVLDEEKLYTDQPDAVILFSWHIADELMPKIKSKGFRGDFIVPLPEPRVVPNSQVNL